MAATAAYVIWGLLAVLYHVLPGHSLVRDSIPVYGFGGAQSAVVSGRSLHYTVHLKKCLLTSGPEDPELVHTFGGHVTAYRTINDKEKTEIPYMIFHDQRATFNDTGRLVQLSRKIVLWSNNTADVTSMVYSFDLSRLSYMYSHRCTVSTTNMTLSDVDLQTSSSDPERIHSFDDMLTAVEAGRGIHFNAMVFLCHGGSQHSFTAFGGRINNYDIMVADDQVEGIATNVQHVVHYDDVSADHVIDVINMVFYNNRTVDIMDSRGHAPDMDPVRTHVSNCFLQTTMPGGSVNVFAN